MTMTRTDAIALVTGWAGIVADPALTDRGLADYVAIIAPIEPAATAADMARESGCALVARGYLRQVLDTLPPELAPPYVNGHALSDLESIARRAGAIRPATYQPQPGDIVHVGATATAAEHVFIVTSIETEADDALPCGSVQGGMRQPATRYERVGRQDRTIVYSTHGATDHEVGGAVRPIVDVYDLDGLLAHYTEAST
jgi:hypothetical protein